MRHSVRSTSTWHTGSHLLLLTQLRHRLFLLNDREPVLLLIKPCDNSLHPLRPLVLLLLRLLCPVLTAVSKTYGVTTFPHRR